MITTTASAKPGQHHGVEVGSGQHHDQGGGEDGGGSRHERDGGCPPREQGDRHEEPGEQHADPQREEVVVARLLDEVAGRNRSFSTEIPSSPGASVSRVASTAVVTSRVLASGNFWITRIRVGSPSTASPMSGWWSSTTSATSPRPATGGRPLDRYLGERPAW